MTSDPLWFWWEETTIGWLPVSADHNPRDRKTPPRRAIKHVRQIPERQHGLTLQDLAKLYPPDEPVAAKAGYSA